MAIAASCRSPALRVRTSRPCRCAAPTRSMAALARSRSCALGPAGPRPCGMRPSATSSSTRVANGSAISELTTAIERAIVSRERFWIGSVQRMTSPLVAGTAPLSARISVVLPAPFGPTMATRSPGPMLSETCCRMVVPPRSTRRSCAPSSSYGAVWLVLALIGRTRHGRDAATRGGTVRRSER